MSRRPIDEQIREHYRSQAPQPETLANLRRLIATAPRRGTSRRRWALTAAAALTAVALALGWVAQRDSRSVFGAPTALVVRQAAAAHNEKQELEVHVHDFAALRSNMKSLDFTPVEPLAIRQMSMRLLGARYTTLAGVMAAQLAYVDAMGVPCTLYEARPIEALASVATGVHQVDGVEVKVWREKGLLMVLTRPPA